MRRKLPTIQESVEDLKARCAAEPNERKQQRIYMLYLLQSQHAKTMKDVAGQLQVHRVTIGYWLRVYEQNGLDGLLGINPGPGRPLSLSQPVLEQLRLYLDIPGYFKSYKEIHIWLRDTFQVDITYKAVHKIVRYGLKVQLKTARQTAAASVQDNTPWEQEHLDQEELYSVSA